MPTQREKGEQFRALHQGPGSFIIPNPWDGATARICQGLGFKALATSSGAQAGTLGFRDGRVSREQALAHCEVIVRSVDIPVMADLEKCFGDDPKVVAETMRRAADIGLVGGSVEDSTGNPDKPFYEFDDAVARVEAACEAARALPFPFTITARAQGFISRTPDQDDVIRRLQAFEKVGADVLMFPGVPTLEAVRAVCAATSKPVNFMAGIPGRSFTVRELTDAGVRRISLSTSLYKAAMGAVSAALKEVSGQGTFGYLDQAMPTAELNGYLGS
jgi:2-methylisocitrate lyase-like PEP mutase family enzyme